MKITVSERMVKVYTLFDIYNTKNILSQCHGLLMRFLIGHKRFPLLIIICDIYLFYMHWQFIVKHQWVYLSYRTLNLFKDSVKL